MQKFDLFDRSPIEPFNPVPDRELRVAEVADSRGALPHRVRVRELRGPGEEANLGAAARRGHARRVHFPRKILSNFSKIFRIYCIQGSIFQHFSKSTRFFQNFVKILQNFCKFLQHFAFFPKISKKFSKFCKIP